ncbi:hypothetical protein GCM10009760_15310 [Kitasatospora kazusensis]|uniref:Fibronectin type-III domain-containing protein n=1 Tax=Kitasatospora kazusensis TaxID=407974 RepID=A0ABN2Z3D2_9ACTN
MGGSDEAAPWPAPVITRVCYDGGVLAVSWTGPEKPSPVVTYVLVLLENGRELVRDWVEATTSGTIAFVPLPGRRYTALVEMYIGGGPHPTPSKRVDVITESVQVERAETDPATGTLTLHWESAGEFLVQLVVNGAAPDPQPPSPAGGGSYRVEHPPPAGATVAAALARVGTDPAVVSTGPYGPGFAVPTERPELLAVGYDAGLLSVAWSAVPGADGYRVSVLTGGEVFGAAVEVAAPATTVEWGPGIPGRGSYRVVVQAVGVAGSGPASAPLALVLGAPTVTAVTSGGASVVIELEPPDFTPTGYAAVLLRDGAPVRRETLAPAGSVSLAVPEPRPRGAAYEVSVRAQAGRSVGPAATAPAVPATAEVAAVVCDADLVVTAAPGHLAGGVPIEAVLLADGVPGEPERVGPDGTAVFAVPPGRVTVAVRGVDGPATGPWSVPVFAPTGAPEATLAHADGDRVELAWTGPPDGTYLAAVGETTQLTRGRTARLPLTGDRATVAQVAGPARGPVTALDLVTAGPRLTAVALGADRSVTLAYAPPQAPALTRLRPVLRWDGTETELPDQPAGAGPLTLTLPEGIPNTATVALRGVAGVAVGPPGEAAVLLTVAPGGVRVAYDGSTLRVCWAELASPLADGYRVVLTADGRETVLGDTTAGSGSWPAEIADAAATVTVRGLAGLALGAPSVPVPVYTETLVIGPSFLAPQRGPELKAFELTLGLPELFRARRTGPVELPLDFVLTPADSGPYAYALRIPASSKVWEFGAARPDVIAEWGEALTELAALGLTPYGFAALGEAVSRSIPQTFTEMLYFAYGLRFDQGYFDLRPGLVLRAEYESYQSVQADLAVSGFVTGGVADYEVASYDNGGTWTNGLDAFLARLTVLGGVEVPDPTWPSKGELYGSGGVLDLFAAPLAQPYARLVYPATLESAIPAKKGSLKPQNNVVLLAAAELGKLDQATKDVRERSTPTGAAAAYLRGRAVIRALVRVGVNGAPRLVPVGTTLGNLLASEGRRPPAVGVPLTGVTVRRPRTAAAPADGPAGDWPVLPGWRPRDPAALDLPLLHGDRIEIGTDCGR